MVETAQDVSEGDINWAVAKLRMEFAYSECLTATPPQRAMAVCIGNIYQYGEQYPDARACIVALVGADQ